MANKRRITKKKSKIAPKPNKNLLKKTLSAIPKSSGAFLKIKNGTQKRIKSMINSTRKSVKRSASMIMKKIDMNTAKIIKSISL
jgi:hypothetical protein